MVLVCFSICFSCLQLFAVFFSIFLPCDIRWIKITKIYLQLQNRIAALARGLYSRGKGGEKWFEDWYGLWMMNDAKTSRVSDCSKHEVLRPETRHREWKDLCGWVSDENVGGRRRTPASEFAVRLEIVGKVGYGAVRDEQSQAHNCPQHFRATWHQAHWPLHSVQLGVWTQQLTINILEKR